MYVMALAFAFEDIQKVSSTTLYYPIPAIDVASAQVIQASSVRVMESSQLLELRFIRHGRSISRSFQPTHGRN